MGPGAEVLLPWWKSELTYLGGESNWPPPQQLLVSWKDLFLSSLGLPTLEDLEWLFVLNLDMVSLLPRLPNLSYFESYSCQDSLLWICGDLGGSGLTRDSLKAMSLAVGLSSFRAEGR